MKTLIKILALGIGALLLGSAQANGPVINFQIAAQPLDRALTAFGQQSGLQIAFYPNTVAEGMYSRDLRGSFTPVVALQQLLADTNLRYEFVNERTIAIREKSKLESSSWQIEEPSPEITRLAQVSRDETETSAREKAPQDERIQKGRERDNVPEILVKEARILNMDIKRTRDDSQPYVVFDRKAIEQSGATNLEDFFDQRLPMNMQFVSGNQGAAPNGNSSLVTLRGLPGQTLILIDGHRTADVGLQGEPGQHDINGIPLSAVERVEVLPTTASGIYGGSATAGVINIILRRDYEGVDVKMTYDNTFGAESGRRRVDVGSGFALEGGKTSVLLAGSYEDSNPLTAGERSFTRDYLAQYYAASPTRLLPPFTPPLGATTNICSGSFSCNGTPLTLKAIYGGTVLSSSFTSVPYGYVGPASDSAAQLVARAGQYNLEMPLSAQTNGEYSNLLAGTQIKSFTGTISRDFGEHVRGFIDAGLSENRSTALVTGIANLISLPASAASNPFQQTITISVPNNNPGLATRAMFKDQRVVGGVIVDLPKGWRAETDYTWNRTTSKVNLTMSLSPTGSNAISSGALDVFRDTGLFPLDYSPYFQSSFLSPQRTVLEDATVRFAGPVGHLPAGSPQLSLLAETRRGTQEDSAFYIGAANLTLFFPERSQSVDSASAELRVPIVSAKNRRTAIEELELQVSTRHDRYTTRGVTGQVNWIGTPDSPPVNFPTLARAKNEVRSTDYTTSLSWKPISDIVLRGSYSTGFLPPGINQLIATNSLFTNGPNFLGSGAFGLLRDPLRGGTQITTGDYISGGNPNLDPEESESWSVGLILTPRFIRNLRWSVDYVNIRKDGNIAGFPGGTQALINATAQGLYSERIARGTPSASDIAAGWAGPITQLDGSLFNIAKAEIKAFDTQLDYSLETPIGVFDFFALATYQPHYQTQITSNQPIVERVGFDGGALKFKGTAGLNWNRGPWMLAWNTRYFHSYLAYPAGITQAEITGTYQLLHGPDLLIQSQIYHDVSATYEFDKGERQAWIPELLSGAEIQLGVRNVFNKKPPRFQQQYSRLGDPRVSSYWLSFITRFGR